LAVSTVGSIKRGLRVALQGVAMAALLVCAHAADVLYVYDDLGRLRQAVAPDTSNAVYNYDAAGNITSITKNTTTTVAIAWVFPSVGPAGTTVSIYGGGFNTTPANNTVTFNGTAATVSAATANKLTVTVPGGATSGTIGVSNTNGSATSGQTFTVGSSSTQAPTISSFTPTIGTSGTSITVTGTNFQTTTSRNKLTFGTWAGPVSSATSTSIGTSSPTAGASGKISITTPYGTAVSSADFYAVPTGAASDVQYTARIVTDGSSNTVTTTTNGKKAILIFDGVQNQSLSLGLTGGTFAGGATTTVYSPVGDSIVTASTTNNSRVDLVSLPLTGTYTVLISPGASDKGSITAQLKSNVTGTLSTTSGTTTTATIGTAQASNYSVSVVAGTILQSEALNGSLGTSATLSWVMPDGTIYTSTSIQATGGFISPMTMPVSGLWGVLLQPGNTTGGKMDFRVGTVDLAISNLSIGSVTTNANGSYSFPLTYTVTNGGTGAVQPNYRDLCYLSANGTLDTSDPVYGTYTRLTALNPSANYTNTLTCTTATTTNPGSYTTFLMTDGTSASNFYATGNGVFLETNETNNVLSTGVTLPTRSDLVASGIGIGTITANANGTFSIPVSYTVTNNGGSVAPNVWYDMCFLSTNGTLDSSDIYLGLYQRPSSLGLGANYSNTITCNAPSSTASGNYTIFLKADSGSAGGYNPAVNNLVESDETNNTLSSSITLPVRADLVPSGLGVGAVTANANGSFTFQASYTVTNNGGSTALPSWYDMCWLSVDGALDASDAYLGLYQRTTSLGVGSNYSNSITCTTPTSTASGTYTLFVKTDTGSAGGYNPAVNNLVESDETNNIASTSVVLPTRADLSPGSLTIGTIVKNGNNSYTIPVTYTVTNNGGAPAPNNWYDMCYLSTNGTLDTSDAYLGLFQRTTPLGVSNNYTNTINCTTSTTTSAGNYTIFLKTDGAQNSGFYAATPNSLVESDETNNVSSAAITLP
jgi:YD repeat-containing protein